MKSKKGEKLSQLVVKSLQERSRKALQYAKKSMLAEKVENKKLCDALEHYASYWNDFTHPGLFSLSYEAVGGCPEEAIQVQTAIAMMAAAFDVHDDIIDESKEKHGVPTVFGKYGKDIALLLGNAFLVKGFAFFSKSLGELDRKKADKIVDAFQASLFELGNAHALELDLRNRANVEAREYMRVVQMKAASIESDMRIGAIIGEGTDAQINALARYGRILGVLGTLREEFVDAFESDELSQRIQSEYLPIPVLYAMESKRVRSRIHRLLAGGKVTKDTTNELVNLVFETRGVKSLKTEMEDLVRESIVLAHSVGETKATNELRNLAASTLEDL
jgi:geranylgeranyl pyrophosphate synthase